MTDWDQFARNLLYGAVHRPAQVLGWVSHRFVGEAAPIGQALMAGVSQIDAEAFNALSPTLMTTPPVQSGPGGSTGPPPPSGQWAKPLGFPLSCPGGYDLIHIGVDPVFPIFTCQLSSTPLADRFPARLPPASDLTIGLPPL